MATANKKGRTAQPLPEARKSDLAQMADRIAENPLLYVGAVLFVILCGLAGLMIRLYQGSANQAFATQYARAMELEEPAKVAAALEPLTDVSTRTTPEVLYMLGETAYKAGDFEKAASAYKELREKYPDSPFVPDAVEGLGYIEENALRYDEARAFYQEVIDNWPESFAAKRQQFNIGRSLERGGDANAAIEAYRAQTLTFPNSRVAMAAQTELERLQRELGLDVTETEGVSDIQQMLQDVTGAGQTATPDPAAGAEAPPADTTATPEADDSTLKLTLPDMEIVEEEASAESTAPSTEGEGAESP